jgi:ribosomal protein L4
VNSSSQYGKEGRRGGGAALPSRMKKKHKGKVNKQNERRRKML